MKLKKFNIKNYKSILELGECDTKERIIVLAGKNESGKTNILEALFKLNQKEKFETKEQTLDSKNSPEIEATFLLDEEDVKKILTTITEKYNVSFTKEQTEGFYKQNKEVSITKNQEDIFVDSEISSGIIKISNKDVFKLIDSVNELNKKFVEKGKDLLGEPKISISENDDMVAIKLKSTQFIALVQNNIALLESEKSTALEIIQSIKTLSDAIQKPPSSSDILNVFVSFLPNLVLFKSFDEEKIKDTMTLEEARNSQFVKDIAKITSNLEYKFDIDEIIKKQADDFLIQNFQDNFSATITRDFMGYWDPNESGKIDQVDIKVRIANNRISFFVSNPLTKIKMQLHPSQRSKGFQWFLSFYTRILANTNVGKDNIILIDEPGLFLHAKAQESVLKVLNNLKDKDQIIYSTHSPYLIEENNLERIRLVEKDKNDHTEIVNKFYDTRDKDTLTPILTAIGHDIFSGITFDEKKNTVIVEGISDYLIIKTMIKHLDYNFNNTPHIIPMKGADSIAKYVPFFIGWELNFIVVLDNDTKGNKVKTDLINKWLVKTEQIISIPFSANGTIEDLFAHKEYFNSLLGGKEYDDKKPISSQVNDGQKVIAAKGLQKALEGSHLTLSAETKDGFTNLFKQLNNYFKK